MESRENIVKAADTVFFSGRKMDNDYVGDGRRREYAELVSGFQCGLCFQAVNSTKKPTYYVLPTTTVIESLTLQAI